MVFFVPLVAFVQEFASKKDRERRSGKLYIISVAMNIDRSAS